MKVGFYCVKDDFLGFQTPFCSMSDEAAIRDFDMMVSKEGTIFNIHRENFNLYRLGTFDSESGEVENKSEFLIAGTSIRRKDVFKNEKDN